MSLTPPPGLDWGPSDVLALTLRLSCWPSLVSAIELAARPEMFADVSLMGWEVGRLRNPLLVAGRSGRVADALMNHATFVRLLWLRVALAGALLVAPSAWLLHPAAIAAMTGLLLLWGKRNTYGQDGADQMLLIIWLAALVAVVLGGEGPTVLCLWFLACQAGLAYTVAGYAKLGAAGWRRGEFLPGVLGTTCYGTPRVGGLLRRHRRMALAGSWTVLLFETSFPLAWLLPWPWGVGYLALGLAFHVTNAFLMGLGSFLTTFLAVYPAVWFTLRHKGW